MNKEPLDYQTCDEHEVLYIHVCPRCEEEEINALTVAPMAVDKCKRCSGTKKISVLNHIGTESIACPACKDTVSISRSLAEQFRKYAAHQITNPTHASALGDWVRADTELKQALEASNGL